jgi:pimeloyl-ACP methyl ester carboxylesterase
LRQAIRQGVASLLLLVAAAASAQDYEREKRWADEVAPAVVVGDAVWIEAGSGRKFLGLYAPAKADRPALVIVHGLGVHPDHGVIGVLRARMTDLGYTTLSIQMPVLAAELRSDAYYPKLFPDALDRIARATEWMRAKGHARLVLVTHSLGSWMANEYLDANPNAPYEAWVCMGLTGGYTWGTYFGNRPILDVYGEEDLPPALDAAWRRRITLATTHARSRQVMIPGADHFYAKRELAQAIDAWLREGR